MCTLIPVIYPTQAYIMTRSVSAVFRGPWGLWSTHYQLPTPSTTGSRTLSCLKPAWVLIRSPKRGSNRASKIPYLVRHQRLQLQAFAVNSSTSQGRRSLIYRQGKVAVTYRVQSLINVIAPYEELSLKARDQQMEKPRFK